MTNIYTQNTRTVIVLPLQSRHEKKEEVTDAKCGSNWNANPSLTVKPVWRRSGQMLFTGRMMMMMIE